MFNSGQAGENRPGSVRELMVVALPLMIGFASQSVISFIDRIFLTWSSNSALAATMPASMLNWSLISFALGVANYTGAFVAQYEGAHRKDRVVDVIWQSTWLCLLMGFGLSLCSLAAPFIFRLADHPEDVQRQEVIYFTTICLGAPVTLLMTALSGFFSGRGRTAIVMWVHLVAVVVNFVLDYVLIFGNSSVPPLGILGAGLATVISNLISTGLFILLVMLHGRWERYPFRTRFSLDLELAQRMIRYGIPAGFQIFVDIFGFTIFLFFVGKLGTVELAATNLAFNLNSLAFIPMLGLGTAVMTLVGKRIGEARPEYARQTVQHALKLGITYMLVWCAAYLFLPQTLITPFRAYSEGLEFAEVESLATILLRFIAIYGVFDVLAIVYSYAIRGAGDAFFPVVFYLLASLFCLILPCTYIWYFWQGSLIGNWVVVTIYILIVGIGMWWRYEGGQWEKMTVMNAQEREAAMNESETLDPA